MRIALFVTCIGDTLFREAGRATVQVLERLGHEVVFPEGQTCCGQMHLNSGYAAQAQRLGRPFAGIFGDYDAVVSPSSSCVGTVRDVMRSIAWLFGGPRRLTAAQRLGRVGQRAFVQEGLIRRLPGPLAKWTRTRDLRPVAGESFRMWWRREHR